MKLKYFKLSEFDSPDDKGSGENMKEVALKGFDKARGYAGISFNVNSGFRTKKHNKKVGGKANSAHTKGYAADFKCTNSANRLKMLTALIKAGCKRIGIAKTFIHADFDPKLPQEVIWLY